MTDNEHYPPSPHGELPSRSSGRDGSSRWTTPEHIVGDVVDPGGHSQTGKPNHSGPQGPSYGQGPYQQGPSYGQGPYQQGPSYGQGPYQQAPAPRRRHGLGTAVVIGIGLVILDLAIRKGTIQSWQIIFLICLIPSIILHEVSHGAVAYLFGDDTAKKAGRLTLNPIAHIDPFGSIILPALMMLTAGIAIGWAKPVPVNVSKLRSPRNQGLLVSLAGPVTNVLIALFAALAYHLLPLPATYAGFTPQSLPLPQEFLLYLGVANVMLAAFNLIPIPPLDGSAFIERLLPQAWWPGYLRIRMFSLPLVFVVVFVFPGVMADIFNPALQLWLHLI